MRTPTILSLAALLWCASTCDALTYYVDHEKGIDTNAGTQLDSPWKRAPGDPAATDKPKSTKLQPGDVVKFKGGVVYRGALSVTASGAEGQPIVYDGNAAGDWGTGKAIIDGSVPLEGLKACTSAEEAWGNPNYKNIYWTTVPKGAKWNSLNVYQGLTPLAWSQNPNPADPNFQEDPRHFHKTDPEIPQTLSKVAVRPLPPMKENAKRPLSSMFDGGKDSAVVENMVGGEIELTLEQPVTVVEFSVTPQPKYTNPKEMSFSADGKELLRVELANNPEKKTEQRFKLSQPATFKTLVIKFISTHPAGEEPARNWGAIAAIGAYDAQNKNVLLSNPKSLLRNEKVFNQPDARYYDNALLALYAKPAQVYYKRILSYDPAAQTIHFETLTPAQSPYEKNGAFSIVNSPRHIDVPGEYALLLDPEPDGSHKLFVWPPDGKPENLTRGKEETGISVTGSYVTLQGFWIRKQGWGGGVGVSGRGKGTDLIIRDVKVSNLRGDDVGITTTQIDNVLVDSCEVSDNAGHTKGIVLRNASNIVVRNCTLRRNSSTALDYYTVTNGAVQNCVVTENIGMHANGLTFYVGCKNIVVEGNTVRDGNTGLTVQDGDGMIIRNNVIEGGRGSPAIGLWAGVPYNNIVITNNVLRYHGDGTTAAVYGGNANAKGYAIVNNVIDGISGNVLLKADMHHNIFTQYGPGMKKEALGKNLLVANHAELFIDPAKHDYRLKPASPAIDAGVALTTINRLDRNGLPRPLGKAVDIGMHEVAPSSTLIEGRPSLIEPRTFTFTMDGYTIADPAKQDSTYVMKFKQREGAKPITLKGTDKTDEGGGKVNLRVAQGGYISGWDEPGHWLEWTVEVPEAGAYEVAIEHGSENPATRQVLVNGEVVKGLEAAPFNATGAWTRFEKAGLDVPLKLKAGKNVIRFVNVTGAHNFKTLEFIPVVAD